MNDESMECITRDICGSAGNYPPQKTRRDFSRIGSGCRCILRSYEIMISIALDLGNITFDSMACMDRWIVVCINFAISQCWNVAMCLIMVL